MYNVELTEMAVERIKFALRFVADEYASVVSNSASPLAKEFKETEKEYRNLLILLTSLKQGSTDETILQLLRQGRRIEAIKERRTATREGLREAKDYVDNMGLRLGILVRKRDKWNPNIELIGYPD